MNTNQENNDDSNEWLSHNVNEVSPNFISGFAFLIELNDLGGSSSKE
jgi:hypothetical protein